MSWEKIGETEKYNIWKTNSYPYIYNVFDKDFTPSELTGGYNSLEAILEIKRISFFKNFVGD